MYLSIFGFFSGLVLLCFSIIAVYSRLSLLFCLCGLLWKGYFCGYSLYFDILCGCLFFFVVFADVMLCFIVVCVLCILLRGYFLVLARFLFLCFI